MPRKRAPAATSEQLLRDILEATTQLRNGHFHGYMAEAHGGVAGELAKVINQHFAFLRAYHAEHLRLAEEIGITGRLGGQMELPPQTPEWHGGWKQMADATNLMSAHLTGQFRDCINVVEAQLRGKHDARITSTAIGGEFRVFRERFNLLVEGRGKGGK